MNRAICTTVSGIASPFAVIIMRPVPAIVSSLFLFSSTLPAYAETGIAGQWSGTYSCGTVTAASMTLNIEKGEDVVEGVFAFESQGQTGSYRIAGRLMPDGGFRIVPRDWIERPSGYSALGLEGRLSENGRLIEGNIPACGLQGSFKATRALTEGQKLPDQEPPAPMQTGSLTGLWKGGIGCRMNRRGVTETYPLTIQLFADGEGLGALAWVQIYKKRGAGVGPAFDQYALLSGTSTGGNITLGGPILLTQGGAGIRLVGISARLSSPNGMDGTVNMSGCETMAANRAGPAETTALPQSMAGLWTGSAGKGGDISIALHVLPDTVPPMVELRASYPANRPEVERDRLRRTFVPIMSANDRVVLMPVSFREATGRYALRGQDEMTYMRALVLSLEPDSTLVMQNLTNELEVLPLLSAPITLSPPPQRVYVLSRPSAEEAEAIAAGEAPPVAFGGSIGGLLAAAPSREAQCRVLDAWLQPHAEGLDPARVSFDSVMASLTPAFEDPAFEPVFGIPFLLTTQPERTAVSNLVRETCDRGMGMNMLGVTTHFLSSDMGFAKFTAMMTDRAETSAWSSATRQELAALPGTQDSLARIKQLRADLRKRSRDLTQGEREQIEVEIASAELAAKIAMLMTEAEQLPTSGFETGALDQVFRLMRDLEAKGIDHAAATPVRAVAEAKARAILDQPLRDAAAEGARLPITLDGLRQGRKVMNHLRPYMADMDTYFGTIDRDGILRPLFQRLSEIQADSGVQTALRDVLMRVEPGANSKEAVRNAAAEYVDLDDLLQFPALAEIVYAATERAEIAAVNIIDDSANPGPGEPTAAEIAAFALGRVKEFNAQTAAAEEACMSGSFTNSIEAIACLSQPGIITGKKGFGARLLQVRKIGCTVETEGIQYLCIFTQEIQIDIPGGEIFGGDTLVSMGRNLMNRTPVDARFIRIRQGGWNVITGDLK